MRIGIIGAGNIGGALTRRLRELGHDVQVANSRGPETLQELAHETGATPVTVPEAARDKDIVVVTIPQARIPELPADLFASTSDDLVVIDTGNYYPRQRDGRIEALEDGVPESRWVEQQLGRPVIKVFNNIFYQHLRNLGRPASDPGRSYLPIAGDNVQATGAVTQFLDSIGYGSVDYGPLAESWRKSISSDPPLSNATATRPTILS